MPQDSSCTKCPLHKGVKNVCIYGAGSTGGLMVVGGVPNRSDDRAALAFSDKDGAVLKKALQECGLTDTPVYVTNAVKCYTASKKGPSNAEIHACREYLCDEIKTCSPKIILALGDTALHALCGRRGVERLNGKIFRLRREMHTVTELESINVVAALHPSAVARNPGVRAQFLDAIRVGVRLASGQSDTPLVEYSRRTAVYLGSAPTESMVAFDYETNGKEILADDFAVTMLGLQQTAGVGENPRRPILVCPLPQPGAIGATAQELTRVSKYPGAELVGQNSIAFDAQVSRRLTGEYPETHDTLFLAHLVDENGSHDLETLCTRYLGVSPWKHMVEAGFDAVDESTLMAYNALDVVHTSRLFNVLKAEAKRIGVWDVYDKIMRHGGYALADATWRGVAMDEANRLRVEAQLEGDLQAAFSAFAEIAPGVNPASPKQVGKLLYDTWGIQSIAQTPSGAASTAELTLKILSHTVADERLRLGVESILLIRGLAKSLSTYVRGWTQYRAADGRLHARYSLLNLTGRTATQDPAFQTLPREGLVRGIVTAQPGGSLVCADYSTIEMRGLAMLSRDHNMIEAFNAGADLHRLLGSTLTHKPAELVSYEERQAAKVANFLLGYLGSPNILIDSAIRDFDVFYTFAEAEDIHDAYHTQWPGLHENYYPETIAELQKFGYVTTLTGRRRNLPGIYSADRFQREAAIRQAVNAKVQSFALDLALKALDLTRRAGLPLVGFVHDSIMLDVPTPPGHRDTLAAEAELKDIMEVQAPRFLTDEFGVDFTVPIKVDTKICEQWS